MIKIIMILCILMLGGCAQSRGLNVFEEDESTYESMEADVNNFNDLNTKAIEDYNCAVVKTLKYRVDSETEFTVICYENNLQMDGISVEVGIDSGEEWQSVDSEFQLSNKYWGIAPRNMREKKCLDVEIVLRDKQDKLRFVYEEDKNNKMCLDVVWINNQWVIDSLSFHEGICFWQMDGYIDPTDLQFSDWKTAYLWIINEWKGISTEKKPVISLYDFDENQIPELLVTDQLDNLHLFRYKDERIFQIDEWATDGTIYMWEGIVATAQKNECRFLRYVNGDYHFGIYDYYSNMPPLIDYAYQYNIEHEYLDNMFNDLFPLYIYFLNNNENKKEDNSCMKMEEWDDIKGEHEFLEVIDVEYLEDYSEYNKKFGIEVYERNCMEDNLICNYRSGRIRNNIFADILVEDQCGNLIQQINYHYWLRSASSLFWGNGEKRYEVFLSDVNEDDYKDIWISLGWDEKTKGYGCFVYDQISNQYLRIDGFEKIMCPRVMPGGIRLCDTHYPLISKYILNKADNKWIVELEGTLFQERQEISDTTFEESIPLYTEYHYENGEIIYSREHIPFEYIDLGFWNYDVSELIEE